MENNTFTLLHFWTTHFKNSDKLKEIQKKIARIINYRTKN